MQITMNLNAEQKGVLLKELFALPFGGKGGRGGLLKMMYGKKVAAVAGAVVFGVLSGIGLMYIYSGAASQLVQFGYYD